MSWENDKARTIQPYFVMETSGFKQNIYRQKGISHFYTFSISTPHPIHVVPDGCVDLIFAYIGGRMTAWVCGPVMRFCDFGVAEVGEYFGVRFLPGNKPVVIANAVRDLVDKRVPFESVADAPNMIAGMSRQTDFYKRIKAFIKLYSPAWGISQEQEPLPSVKLARSIRDMIFDSDGKISVTEISKTTGYSNRYIERIFMGTMGFSPKTYCKILQFQRAIIYLNYGAPGKMAEAAVKLGYYDEPQFIRDFKRYCGITPARYLEMTRDLEYRKHVSSVDLIGATRLMCDRARPEELDPGLSPP